MNQINNYNNHIKSKQVAKSKECVLSVTAIVLGNGIGDLNSNPGWDCILIPLGEA